MLLVIANNLIYICVINVKNHSNLCAHHHQFNIENNIKDIFTGICQEKNQFNALNYFCKNHNQLCCAACLCKIKGIGNDGQHKDCDACLIADIKDIKRNKIKENIKCLQDLSNDLEKSISKLNKIFDKINENKEKLKSDVQKVFTKIRNILNEREEELIKKIDNLYDNIFCNEATIKDSEKLPLKIKYSLEKGKIIEKESWNENNKLNSLIYDCINIEKKY